MRGTGWVLGSVLDTFPLGSQLWLSCDQRGTGLETGSHMPNHTAGVRLPTLRAVGHTEVPLRGRRSWGMGTLAKGENRLRVSSKAGSLGLAGTKAAGRAMAGGVGGKRWTRYRACWPWA